MSKKDTLSNINTTALFDTMDTATSAAKPYTADEIAKFKAEMQTQGRKGVKLQRISLATTPEVKEYVRTMCQAANMNYSAFICKLIMDHKRDHMDQYKKAQKAFNAAEALREQL